ncbi:MAG: DNA-directed RNA polymerase subunit H [Candidatus Hodarchaeaceae archaeon]|nr:DNA-directed RNA polymerase subunit H [Candidatus Hodarchaeaceae archaeon]
MVEFDVRRHVLVPKHEVMPPEKAREILEKFRVSPHQLPLVKASDPVAKAIGAKLGDIVKITRDSLTAGKAIIYRYVTEG